jgi:hypothetical protein
MSQIGDFMMVFRSVGWVERSETHLNLLLFHDGYRGVYHRARIRATRWLYPSYKIDASLRFAGMQRPLSVKIRPFRTAEYTEGHSGFGSCAFSPRVEWYP